MGENESGIVPNGLLPNDDVGPIIRIIDRERWLKAERRTAELIHCIQPNRLSEERREAVTKHVVKLVTNCFPCKVFPFGSVPLKTYLPDGDIDLTTFSNNQSAKDTWANMVRDMLEREEKNVNAEYHVKEVQYIQAEVKIVKCLVDNIVVDISFNQLGGLCTLCFLEEVNSLIKNDHLFKRSIILIKAWCYYESRILGAHHGLISTYALETLVLYILHVYNNSFTGPLEVLYRFLEFFSNFDWENFCISLWGPVPVQSLPDMTPQSPRKDCGELLLKKSFLESCCRAYSVIPGALETHGTPFVAKFFNVIDPLRANNNLGRSVGKGNFFRIRSAFAFGFKKLARLLDCPNENIYLEVNQFFMNTWSRHGSGVRPDAMCIDFGGSKSPHTDPSHGCEISKNDSRDASTRKIVSDQESETAGSRDDFKSTHHGTGTKSMTSPTDVMASSLDNKSYTNPISSSTVSNRSSEETSLRSTKGSNDKVKKGAITERVVSDGQNKFFLARTHSSPELTDAYNEDRSLGKLKKFMETGKTSKPVVKGERQRNPGHQILERNNTVSSVEVPSSVGQLSSHKSAGVNKDYSISSSQCHDDSEVVEQGTAVEKHIIKQKEQDIANFPVMFPGLNGTVPVPHFLNSSAAHLPVPLASFLASAGYIPRNIPGNFSGNPFMEHPWGANLQIAQGMFPQMARCFPNVGHISNLDDIPNRFSERLSFTDTNSDAGIDGDHDVSSSGGFDMDNGSMDMQLIEDQLQSNSSSRIGSSHSATGPGIHRRNDKFTRDSKGSVVTESVDSFRCSNYTDNDFFLDRQTANVKNPPVSRNSSLRSRTSSESSCDGLSVKTTKTVKEKRGRKITPPDIQSTVHRKGNVPEDKTNRADNDAYRDSSTLSPVRTERNTRIPSNTSKHQFAGSETTQVNGSDVITFSPSQKKPSNESGAPFTFFPTGPPVPFFTMLPLYNFPSGTLTSERTSPLIKEAGLNKDDTGGSIEASEINGKSEDLSVPDVARKASTSDHKSDILNGDFPHHLVNLQYGRLCQEPPQAPSVYPHSAVVPPMYLPGQVPWVGPGRPSVNLNQIAQFMSYGPRVGPLAPFQAMPYRPVNPYQQIADEMPRYRSGTGTYLPNPTHVRERPSSGSQRGHNNDRNEHNSDREGNWNQNKVRPAGRNHARNSSGKPGSRLDRWATNESHVDRPLASYGRSDSYQNHNGHINTDISGHGNLAYGMHPRASGYHNAVSSSGTPVSPMMKLYPYDQYRGYGLSADQLEFGSLGQPGQASTSGGNEMATEQSFGNFEEQIYHSRHGQWHSPDQPSSPQVHRRI